MIRIVIGIIVNTFAFTVFANAQSPYAGQEAREIKALSQSEIDDYLSGKGMGYAKAAELNHYPGPRHVLDLAIQLELTQEQTKQTQKLFDLMKESATTLGKQLVEKERELDRLFASGSMDADTLKVLLSDIGELQAKIRYVHLSAHLKQKTLLTRHQTMLYDQLRGYGTDHGDRHNHAH